MQPYFPELVYQRYDREVTKPLLAMDYSGFGIIAVKAIQEQQKIIEDLQKKVEASNTSGLLDIIKKQQDAIDQLSKRIELLEKK